MKVEILLVILKIKYDFLAIFFRGKREIRIEYSFSEHFQQNEKRKNHHKKKLLLLMVHLVTLLFYSTYRCEGPWRIFCGIFMEYFIHIKMEYSN
jgi:hypothetical protein